MKTVILPRVSFYLYRQEEKGEKGMGQAQKCFKISVVREREREREGGGGGGGGRCQNNIGDLRGVTLMTEEYLQVNKR